MLDSCVGVMGVLRRLAVATMRRLGPPGRRRPKAIETLHESLGDVG